MISTGYDATKIVDVILSFNSEVDYEKLLNTILTKMMEITHSDGGTIYTIEDNELHFRILKNISLDIHQTEGINLPPIVLDADNVNNISAYSAINNEVVVIDDVYASDRFNFDGPKNYDKITGYRTRSMLTLPLATVSSDGKTQEVIGVIQLLNCTNADGTLGAYVNIENPPVIPALAKIAASTLANIGHIQEIYGMFRSFVSVMTQAIDERSAYNTRHTINVARFVMKFIDYLNANFAPGSVYHFDKSRREQMELTALLHDIGKIVTPVEVMDKATKFGDRMYGLRYRFDIAELHIENSMLKNNLSHEEYSESKRRLEEARKLAEYINESSYIEDEIRAKIPDLKDLHYIKDGVKCNVFEDRDIDSLNILYGTLTEKERAVMQEHVKITARLLDKLPFYKYYEGIPKWASDHHELLDGNGYPKRLKGDQIVLESRLLTICDIFEALTAEDRPYKNRIPLEKAISILIGMADEGKLDGELVKLFIKSEAWVQ